MNFGGGIDVLDLGLDEAIRGFTFVKLANNPSLRAELQGQPVFRGLLGPMWDGDAIRYEDQASNDFLST